MSGTAQPSHVPTVHSLTIPAVLAHKAFPIQAELVGHPLSLDSIEIADFTLGDLHGNATEIGHPEIEEINSNSISVGGLSLSLHGLSTQYVAGKSHVIQMLCMVRKMIIHNAQR